MVALALDSCLNLECCECDRIGWCKTQKILYKPISIPGIHVFSAWKSTTHNVAHSASRSAPTAQYGLWVAYFSFFFPSLFCICFFHSIYQLGSRGTGGNIVCWLSRISTPVCRERMSASLYYKYVREQTMMPTLQRRTRMFRNNPASAFKTMEK